MLEVEGNQTFCLTENAKRINNQKTGCPSSYSMVFQDISFHRLLHRLETTLVQSSTWSQSIRRK